MPERAPCRILPGMSTPIPRPVYLDYNATTPVAPEVVAAMLPYLHELHGNPSSSHAAGRRVRQGIEQARAQIAVLLGAAPEEIIFTSGGSEANNHAIKGTAWTKGRGHLVISAVEHPAVARPAQWLAGMGFDLSVVGVDPVGRVDPDEVRRALRPDTILVSIMLANNEVGTIQPLAEIARVVHQGGAWLHTDAAQAVGKVPVRVDDLGVDLLTIAGHKFHAPSGTGALYVRQGIELTPLIQGAGHEKGRRAGTENISGIMGLGAAAELAGRFLTDGGPQRVRALRDRFHRAVADALGDRVRLNGDAERRLPNTLNLGFRGHIGPDLLAALPNVCASPGAACHADRHEPSSVLKAMEVPRDVALGAIRFSFGRYNTQTEIDFAAEEVVRVTRG